MPSVHSFASAVHNSQEQVVSTKLQIKTIHPTKSHIGKMCIQFTWFFQAGLENETTLWLKMNLLYFTKMCWFYSFLNSVQSWNEWKDYSICICDPRSENPALPTNIEFELEAILSIQVVFQLNSNYCTKVLQGACTVSYWIMKPCCDTIKTL